MTFLTEHLFEFGYIDSEDFHLFKVVSNVAEAVQEILHFYSVYQSSRWVGQQLVIRISQRLSKAALVELNQEFSDIVRTGEIIQRSALRQEKNELEIWDLPRLVLSPHRRSFGRFRQLIDAINATEGRS